MAIPEPQLEVWSHQGSIAQSAQTYDAIQRILNDSTSPFYSRDFSVFLQGSYGNDTNVYRDSDVDVVICLNQTYYADTSPLGAQAKQNYDGAFRLATYAYADFKTEVLAWLMQAFGVHVESGKKAIFIKGSGNRRDVDVLVCAQYRRYRSESTGVDTQYDEGIVFWTSHGAEIVNFPKQHRENCTNKHQNTRQQFKRMVRMYKNMRNRMLDEKCIADGVAPSYYLEGMLWNVPDSNFVQSFEDSFVNTFNWVINADSTRLVCANRLDWLVRDNSNVSWSAANFDAYLAAANRYWAEWSV